MSKNLLERLRRGLGMTDEEMYLIVDRSARARAARQAVRPGRNTAAP